MGELVKVKNGKVVYRKVLKDRPLKFNVWKCIKGYEGIYQVSMGGEVRRIKKSAGARIRTLVSFSRAGYLAVHLYRNGKKTTHYVHRLVAETFIPNTKSKVQVNHKDGNKKNARSVNLEWCTAEENIQHRITVLGMDPSRIGRINPNAILTESDVVKIKSSILKQKELASIYKVSRSTIAMIRTGKIWKWVT